MWVTGLMKLVVEQPRERPSRRPVGKLPTSELRRRAPDRRRSEHSTLPYLYLVDARRGKLRDTGGEKAVPELPPARLRTDSSHHSMRNALAQLLRKRRVRKMVPDECECLRSGERDRTRTQHIARITAVDAGEERARRRRALRTAVDARRDGRCLLHQPIANDAPDSLGDAAHNVADHRLKNDPRLKYPLGSVNESGLFSA